MSSSLVEHEPTSGEQQAPRLPDLSTSKAPQPGADTEQTALTPVPTGTVPMGTAPTGTAPTPSAMPPRTPSGRKLESLAQPRVFQGPEVELQKSIVAGLEEELPALQKKYGEPRKKGLAAINSWYLAQLRDLGKGLDKEAIEKERRKRTDALPTDYALGLLYIGSIELTAATPFATDDDVIRTARLVHTDHSLESRQDGTELTQKAGVQAAVVKNTLRTMQEAGQLEYLRKSGLIGQQWKVLVEVHYYRDRGTSSTNLHKDTLGQTLFVNLNYTNEEEMAGPEFLVNPPSVRAHEDHVRGTPDTEGADGAPGTPGTPGSLPSKFVADLDEARRELPRGTEIGTEHLKPHGVVSFVDELIHHASPLTEHRSVTAEKLGVFLSQHPVYRTDYERARTAHGSVSVTPVTQEAFDARFDAPSVEQKRWKQLLDLASTTARGKGIQRPALQTAGMTSDQVNELVTEHGTEGSRTVRIPGRARTDGKDSPQTIGDETEDGRPATKAPPLKRRMSQLAMQGPLPKATSTEAEEDRPPRRFFRTWVRAVPASNPSGTMLDYEFAKHAACVIL